MEPKANKINQDDISNETSDQKPKLKKLKRKKDPSIDQNVKKEDQKGQASQDPECLPDIFKQTQKIANVNFEFADIDIENVDYQSDHLEKDKAKPSRGNWHLLEPDTEVNEPEDSQEKPAKIEEANDELVKDKQNGFYPTVTGLKFNPHILDTSTENADQH